MNKENILATYKWRFACKEFLVDKKISRDDLDFLLEVVQLSPTSFGLQPFQLMAIENKLVLQDLLSSVWGGQKQLPTASHVFLFVTRKDIRYNDNHITYMLNDVQKWPQEITIFIGLGW